MAAGKRTEKFDQDDPKYKKPRKDPKPKGEKEPGAGKVPSQGEGGGRAERGAAALRKWETKLPVAGYLLRYGDSTKAGVVFEKGDKLLETDVPPWLAERISYDEVGALMVVDLADTDLDKLMEKGAGVVYGFTHTLVESNIGLDQADIAHLLALVAKEKFSLDQVDEIARVRSIRDKLQGFREPGMFEEVEKTVTQAGKVKVLDQPLAEAGGEGAGEGADDQNTKEEEE